MIYSITHKRVRFVPPQKKGYRMLQVGAAGKEKLYDWTDDSGQDHMSQKNPSWCELTGMYWMWKNCPDDIVGLVHYRRYFVNRIIWWRIDQLLPLSLRLVSIKRARRLLQHCDVIVPHKCSFPGKTIREQWEEWHYIKDLDCTRSVIAEKYPEYLHAFDSFTGQNDMYVCNMFIMKRPEFYLLCEWLFDILFEVEKRVDISQYSVQQKRLFGYLSERLLNVWILHHQMKVKEMQMYYIEE